MIGAVYYIGMLAFIVIVPMIADRYGRKWVFQINFFIFIGSTIGILLANDIVWLYILLFISGGTIGGRSVVGINYMLEFQQASKKNLAIFLRLMAYSFLIIVYTLIFQFATRDYKVVTWISLAITILCTIYILIVVPESPQFLCERGDFNDYLESREILTYVARFNGVQTVGGYPYQQFKFTNEKKLISDIYSVKEILDKMSNNLMES